MPALALSHLLRAAVVVTNVGHRVDDHLAIQLQHDTEHTVYGGMVWTQVEEHKLCVLSGAGHTPFLGFEQQRFLLLVLFFLVQAERFHFRGAGRMLLAQRVALPGGWQQDASQVGVAAELDPEHVPGFPLIPVGIGPYTGSAGNVGVVVGHRDLETYFLPVLQVEQVVNHGEIDSGRRLVFAQALVDTEQIQQHGEAWLEMGQNLQQVLSLHPQGGRVVRRLLHVEQVGTEAGEQVVHSAVGTCRFGV